MNLFRLGKMTGNTKWSKLGLKTLKAFTDQAKQSPSGFSNMLIAFMFNQLNSKEKINPEIIIYINRLSDFLFVAARIENVKDGDILWVPNKTNMLGL